MVVVVLAVWHCFDSQPAAVPSQAAYYSVLRSGQCDVVQWCAAARDATVLVALSDVTKCFVRRPSDTVPVTFWSHESQQLSVYVSSVKRFSLRMTWKKTTAVCTALKQVYQLPWDLPAGASMVLITWLFSYFAFFFVFFF